MSEQQQEGGAGCAIMSLWLIGGGICAAVGFPAIIALLVFSTVVGAISAVVLGFNALTGNNDD
jgi:hypothetical protein